MGRTCSFFFFFFSFFAQMQDVDANLQATGHPQNKSIIVAQGWLQYV
jgi:hypothetical protein